MNVVWLGDADCSNPDVAGQKAAGLSRLITDFPIPTGFCITTAAFDRWKKWCQHSGSGSSSRVSPAFLLRAIEEAYDRLAEMTGEPSPAVAVRSSGTYEDGKTSSFAGIHDTYINVSGAGAVADAACRCFSSCNTRRASEYCRIMNVSVDDLRMGVLVQSLVPADVSAVAFSLDPIKNDRELIIVDACWGLCGHIVDGKVNPDRWTIRKNDMVISERRIADKAKMCVLKNQGTEEVAVPRNFRRQPALSDDMAIQIARLAESLEKRTQYAVDIECSVWKDVLYLLQCRRITAWGK